MQRLLETGAISRSTGATRMNDASSRSHAIFTVMLQQRLAAAPPPGAAADQARGPTTDPQQPPSSFIPLHGLFSGGPSD